MSDHDEAAIDAIEQLLRGVEPRQKPHRLKAALRLVGNALAAVSGNDEAASEHHRLGHQHSSKGYRR